MLHKVYLGLGANIGNREENINKAIDMLDERVGKVSKRSSFFKSKPWGFCSDNDFINVCVLCLSALSPHKILYATQQIERILGRNEKSKDGVYHDRLIDIDILLYDDLHVNDLDLKIPHPLMRERDFVMKPLKEIL
jgi:2-amino-4-hydroxy-6-hydroxymethyldihydropteridine diphosphokinase